MIFHGDHASTLREIINVDSDRKLPCGGVGITSGSTPLYIALSRTAETLGTNGKREITEVEQPVLGAKTEGKARFDGP